MLFVLTAAQVVIERAHPEDRIALQFPTEVALATVLPMRWSLAAFRPFITLLNGSATGLLRLLGINLSGHRHLHSPDEIALLIAESRDGGLLEPEEHQRLHKALRLSRSTARDLMVPRDRLTMIDVERAVGRRARARSPRVRSAGCRRTAARPISIVGILRVKDLVHRVRGGGPPAPVEPLLRPFVRVPAALPGDQVIAQASRKARASGRGRR